MFDNILERIDITKLKQSGYSRLFRELFKKPKYLKYTKPYQKQLQKNIFVIIFYSHLKMFLPIARKLKDEKIPFTVITVRDNFKKDLKDFNDEVFSLNNEFSFLDLIIATF